MGEKIVVLTEAGLRCAEAGAERVGETEDALAERMGGQERLEELADSLEKLMALSGTGAHDLVVKVPTAAYFTAVQQDRE